MKDFDSKLEAKQKHQLIDKSLNVKRKKNLTSEKKAIKKKRVLEDTDNEWETETEKSINKAFIGSRGSIDDECIKLFQDSPCTLEKIRDRPIAYEESLHNYESPIICTHRKKRSHLISKKNDIILQDTLLPVNSLTTEVQSLEETGEDETIFLKRKKNLTSEKKAIKKKRVLEDTDNEWETETEKSINEAFIGSRGSIETLLPVNSLTTEVQSLEETGEDETIFLKRKKNLTSEKKAIKKKRVLEDTDNEWETETEKSINEAFIGSRGSIETGEDETIFLKRKKNLTSEKKAIKKKRVLEDTDNEWETETEKSINEAFIGSRGSIETGEDETIFLKRKKNLTSEKKAIKKKRVLEDTDNEWETETEKSINEAFIGSRGSIETGEDETIFQNNAQTHVSLRNPEKISKQKPENFSSHTQLRRDQSVKTYPGKKSRHLPRKTEISISISPGNICVRVYWDKTLRKWIRYEESSSQNKNGKCKTKINKRNTKKVTWKQNVYDTIN
ncbi:uncharacterized protein [Temnothorax longispinosus]|uniref:uncharacterized protein isoform X2 n=1 Tax=Temnothorax longispinosus TaxID=300112 RepID=UPI003A99C4BF